MTKQALKKRFSPVINGKNVDLRIRNGKKAEAHNMYFIAFTIFQMIAKYITKNHPKRVVF